MSTLSKQLLLALASPGLLAPLAVNAQDATATISSSAAISSYRKQQDIDRWAAWSGAWEAQNQVTSVSQFSDVRPTDWAYQALSNLVERYGCVAGYPDGTFKGRVDTLTGRRSTPATAATEALMAAATPSLGWWACSGAACRPSTAATTAKPG